MDCKVAKQLMADYLMGITDEEFKKEFEEHISGCESCKKALEELKKAEQEYDKKDGTEPLKKVNKVIKKHKRGKILAIIGILILVGIVTVFVLGELKPNERKLPSITKMRYKSKAAKIVDEFFNNDMDALLNGTVSYLIPGASYLPYNKADCIMDMLVDYSDRLKEMNKDFLYGKKYEIKNCLIGYREVFASFMGRLYPAENKYKTYNYTVMMDISTEMGNFTVEIQFFNQDNYDFYIIPDLSLSDSPFSDKLLDMNKMITHLYRYASGADYYHNILNGELLNDSVESGEFIGVGNQFATSDCIESFDEVYTQGFNERLAEIYNISKTESVNMEARGYNKEKHAVNIEMIWIIKDLDGHEAVMRKDLLYGPYGYQKLNDEAKIVAEEGFDKELEEKMKKLF